MNLLSAIFIGILSGFIVFREIMFSKERAEWMKMLGSRPLSSLPVTPITPQRPEDLGGKNEIAAEEHVIALEDVQNPYQNATPGVTVK